MSVPSSSENIEQILGYTQREMRDDPDFWTSHIHPQDQRRVVSEVFGLIPKGGGSLEYRFRHHDGHYRWFQDSFRTVLDESGQPVEIVGSWADITQRKLAESLSLADISAINLDICFVPLADILCHGPGDHNGVNQRPLRLRATAKSPGCRLQSSSLRHSFRCTEKRAQDEARRPLQIITRRLAVMMVGALKRREQID